MATGLPVSFFSFFLFLSFSLALAAHSSSHQDQSFLHCLHFHVPQATNLSQLLHFPSTTSYSSLLLSSMSNSRFATAPASKPLIIITPTHESHIQASVICCRKHDLEIRVRSGGHDYEGLSYQSYNHQPFVVVDLANLRSVNVDLEDGTAWVEAGAILGDVYYHIANKSNTHAFPAGICPSVGVGGHISGGGMGFMVRKYGLAADNVLDARVIDIHGKILDKESMGEDLFWAIRGGGGASFGVIISWKIRLVPVPPTVTVFAIEKTSEEGAIKLVNKWQQIADKLPEDLFIEAVIQSARNRSRGVEALFNCLFLGGAGDLLQLMGERFPELGAKATDCKEMSWVESVKYHGFVPSGLPVEALMDRKLQLKGTFKGKSDFVVVPIPSDAWEGIWSRFMEVDQASMFMDPYGGRMNEVPEWATPFPHRKGVLYNIQYVVGWSDSGAKATKEHVGWIRSLYKQMGPYVSKNPRAAYVNFRDLDLGRNRAKNTSYSKASVWGRKYFKNNFERLALVKGEVDPENFFGNEQSIPPLVG